MRRSTSCGALGTAGAGVVPPIGCSVPTLLHEEVLIPTMGQDSSREAQAIYSSTFPRIPEESSRTIMLPQCAPSPFPTQVGGTRTPHHIFTLPHNLCGTMGRHRKRRMHTTNTQEVSRFWGLQQNPRQVRWGGFCVSSSCAAPATLPESRELRVCLGALCQEIFLAICP